MRTYWMQTPRLGFSRWQPQDGALAQQLWGDSRVTRFLCVSGRFSPEQVSQRLCSEIKSQQDDGVQYWPVFALESGELAGCCGLHRFDEDGWELGAHFLPQYWGRGICSEAARAVMDYAFEQLGLRGISAGHHPGNERSRRLITRLGFCYVGDVYYPPTGLLHPSYRKTAPALERKGGQL